MPSYNCNLCDFSTKLRANYLRHLSTPKHKKRITDSYNSSSICQNSSNSLPSFTEDSLNFTENSLNFTEDFLSPNKLGIKNSGGDSHIICDLCQKEFTRRDNMKIHQKKFCKEKDKRDFEGTLQKIIEKALLDHSNKGVIGNYNNNSNNSNSNNNITNSITINNFGNENLDMLTNKFMKAMVDRPYTSIPKMIKKIHFNDNYPENKNIRMLNKKDNKLQIIENGKWTYVDKVDTIDTLVGDKNYQLDDFYEKNKNNFTDRQKGRYNKFQDKLSENDKQVNAEIVKDTDLIFWNHM